MARGSWRGSIKGVMVTERGAFFGYGRLVNDFIGLGDLMELGEGTEGWRDEGGWQSAGVL